VWSALGSKLGPCNERLMTNCLSCSIFKDNTTIITTKNNNSSSVVVVVVVVVVVGRERGGGEVGVVGETKTITYIIIKGVWSGIVVKALHYLSDGPGIDSWWCHWIFQ
jgi:hypothetical protein